MLSNNSIQQSGRTASESKLFETAIETLSIMQTNPFAPTSPSKERRTRRRDGHSLTSKRMYDSVKMDSSTFLGGNVPETADTVPEPRNNRSPLSDSCHCKLCSGEVPEAPEHATWKEVLHCAFRVLSDYYGRQFFSMKTEIVPFIDSHWRKMWGNSKEQQPNWQATVSMIMSKYTHIFKSGSQEMGGSGFWGLGHFDLGRIGVELKNFSYPQVQNKKRNRKDTKESAPPAPKKMRTADDNSMLSVLASVAFECFSIEKSNVLAFVPRDEMPMDAKQLEEEIQQLKTTVFLLGNELQNANKDSEMLDDLLQKSLDTTCTIMKDVDMLKDSGLGMVPNCIHILNP